MIDYEAQGAADFYNGVWLSENPYMPCSMEYKLWSKGWMCSFTIDAGLNADD